MRYKIIINGYGANCWIRRINEPQYNFWSTFEDREVVRDHLFENAYADDGKNPANDDDDPLFLGMIKSKRGQLLNANGPRPCHIHVHVFDENDNTVYASSTVPDEPRFAMHIKDLPLGYYVKGMREQKGTFFTCYVDADKFDINKLQLPFVNIDNEDLLLVRVEYEMKTLKSEYTDVGITRQTFSFHDNSK